MQLLNIRSFFTVIIIFQVINMSISLSAMKRKIENDDSQSYIGLKKQCFPKYPADEFGSKTENLEILDNLAQEVNAKKLLSHNYTVLVPPFIGVSDKSTTSALKSQNIDIQEQWKKIIKNYNQSNNFDVFLQDVQALGNTVNIAFEKLSQPRENAQNFIDDNNLEDFINKIADDNGLITVRSSGQEDTDAIMNAGGNESKEVVQPNKPAVIKATGSDLKSYFSAKSFEQRKVENDPKLLQLPLLAVLVQEVVGELNGNRVVSGVAYTQESLGNTPNIAMIQATHGHGKAVVDNVLPSDTIYINCATTDNDDINGINRIVYKKTHRLVPNHQTLNKVTNDPNDQKKSALNDEALQDFAIVLAEIQNHYGKPMDVEFVINQDKKIIYLVQARPQKKHNQVDTPSYFSNQALEQCTAESTISCSKINYVDGAIRFINDAKQVIATQTLNQALDTFLYNKDYSGATIAIVQEEAKLLSHAGAILSGANITILTTSNINLIKKLLEQKKIELFFDVQRELVIDGSKNHFLQNKTLKELIKLNLVTEGYFSHPIPSIISVPKLQGPLNQLNGMNIVDENFGKLIETIKDGSHEEASTCLKIIQQIVRDKIDDLNILSSQDKILQATAQKALQKLYPFTHELARICSSTQEACCHEARSIKRLYPITFLEALFFQKPIPEIIRHYSYQSILKDFEETKNFIELKIRPLIETGTIESKLAQNYKLLKLAHAGTRVAFTEIVQNDWIKFIGDIAQNFDNEQQKNLIFMLNDIVNLNMLPTWINSRFSAQNGSAQEIFDILFQEYKQDQNFLVQLKEYKDHLDQTNFNAWQEDASFNMLKQNFNEEIFAWFTGQEFTQNIKNSGNNIFAYQAAVSTMNKFIDTFDEIIKSIKSSTTINKQVRAERFKAMVGKYLELLEIWAPLVPEGIIQYNAYWDLNDYLNELRTIFDSINACDSETLPSPHFNVNSTALGSATALLQFLPVTLEDLFTTIHRSLLVVSAGLNLCIKIPDRSLPEKFRIIKKMFDTFVYSSLDIKTIKTGITFDNDSASIFYNAGLRDHGIAVRVQDWYENSSPTLHVNLYGLNGHNRYEVMSTYINLFEDSNQDIYFSDINFDLTSLSCIITFGQEIDTQVLIQLFKKIIDISLFNYAKVFNQMIATNEDSTLQKIRELPADILISNFIEKFQPELQEKILEQLIAAEIPQFAKENQLSSETRLDVLKKMNTFCTILSLQSKINNDVFNKLAKQVLIYINSYTIKFLIETASKETSFFNNNQEELKNSALNILSTLFDRVADEFPSLLNDIVAKSLDFILDNKIFSIESFLIENTNKLNLQQQTRIVIEYLSRIRLSSSSEALTKPTLKSYTFFIGNIKALNLDVSLQKQITEKSLDLITTIINKKDNELSQFAVELLTALVNNVTHEHHFIILNKALSSTNPLEKVIIFYVLIKNMHILNALPHQQIIESTSNSIRTMIDDKDPVIHEIASELIEGFIDPINDIGIINRDLRKNGIQIFINLISTFLADEKSEPLRKNLKIIQQKYLDLLKK